MNKQFVFCFFCSLFFISFLSFSYSQHSQSSSFQVPQDSSQLILGLTKNWKSSHVKLEQWERKDGTWHPVGNVWKGRVGRNGLAWGKGLHPNSLEGPVKKEGDGKAPAGVFFLGDAYGYDSPIALLKSENLTYHQVSEKDLWVEDSKSPHYNQHLQLKDRGPQTEWEHKQQMRLNDPAHRLKLFIKHNADPPIIPYAGSAIFFHIWRLNGASATSGCTVMPENKLRTLIASIRPSQKPVYVLLPDPVYRSVRKEWGLP